MVHRIAGMFELPRTQGKVDPTIQPLFCDGQDPVHVLLYVCTVAAGPAAPTLLSCSVFLLLGRREVVPREVRGEVTECKRQLGNLFTWN